MPQFARGQKERATITTKRDGLRIFPTIENSAAAESRQPPDLFQPRAGLVNNALSVDNAGFKGLHANVVCRTIADMSSSSVGW
jgi:hypothetical protein